MVHAAEDFGEIYGFYRDAGCLQDLLAVADRLEGGGPGADRADARRLETARHAAGRDESAEVRAEAVGLGALGVQRCQTIWYAVLRQNVADGHLPAERVAPEVDAHLRRVVGGRVNQYGYVQAGEAKRLGDRAFVAEVRQRDDHAGDLVGVLSEERRAGLGLIAAFDRAVHRVVQFQRDGVDALFGERAEHLVASRASQVTGEEPAIADEQAQRDAFDRRPSRGALLRLGRVLRRQLSADVGFELNAHGEDGFRENVSEPVEHIGRARRPEGRRVDTSRQGGHCFAPDPSSPRAE